VAATVPVIFGDVASAADTLRPHYALYFGGMGARAANFYADVAMRMGFEADVRKVQELYLAGRKDEAAAAVPLALIDELALIGPPDRVRDRLAAWEDSIVTTLLISGPPETLRTAAGLVLG
jgi:alkanesulfonate monooxygenase SsuD/methylene tetrahydromethanopterin reductase-like flavin-dependent oxidoreductase (luciferase family)